MGGLLKNFSVTLKGLVLFLIILILSNISATAIDISMTFPLNKSYNSSSVNITFMTSNPVNATPHCNYTVQSDIYGRRNFTIGQVNNGTSTTASSINVSSTGLNWLWVTCWDYNLTRGGDSALYINNGPDVNMSVDLANPYIIVHSPTNTSYETTDININFTATDEHDRNMTCTYTLNGTAKNIQDFVLNNTPLTVSNAIPGNAYYSFYISCTDDSKRVGSSSTVYFRVNDTVGIVPISIYKSNITIVPLFPNSKYITSLSMSIAGEGKVTKSFLETDYYWVYGLRFIGVDANRNITQVKFYIHNLTSFPSSIQDISNSSVSVNSSVYARWNITAFNVTQHFLNKVIFQFLVDKNLLNVSNSSIDSVKFYRFDESSNKWVSLASTLDSDNYRYYFFNVTAPTVNNFHFYSATYSPNSIVIQSPAVIVNDTVINQTVVVNETVNNTIIENITTEVNETVPLEINKSVKEVVVNESYNKSVSTVSVTPNNSNVFLVIGLILLLAFGGVVLLYKDKIFRIKPKPLKQSEPRVNHVDIFIRNIFSYAHNLALVSARIKDKARARQLYKYAQLLHDYAVSLCRQFQH